MTSKLDHYYYSHVVFMCLAWLLLAPIGIFSISMLKNKKPGTKPIQVYGKDIFFWIHILSMTLAAVFTVIGTLFIFANEHWNFVPKTHPFYTHSCCGIAVTILAPLQAVFGFYRPEIANKNRKFFNILHWIIGRGLRYLTMATICLATNALFPPNMFDNVQGARFKI